MAFITLLLITIMFTFTSETLRPSRRDLRNVNQARLCTQLPSYVRKMSNVRCTRTVRNVHVLYNATVIASKECKRAFHNQPWNCSSGNAYMDKLVTRSFRESAYVFTLYSASLAFSLASACSNGLVDNCRCIEKQMEETKTFGNGDFVLKGARCFADSIKFGIEESRNLFQNEKHRDAKALIDQHNKEAGRLAVLYTSFAQGTYCHCHGMSGACASKKCVKRLPKFSVIADSVKKLYETAIKVGIDNNAEKLKTAKNQRADPTKKDMIYAEESPTFCDKDVRAGIAGSNGRECDLNPSSPIYCKKLCCNRGYTTQLKRITEPCQCKFKYCCKVECETCSKIKLHHYCK
nr:Wnt6 protein [Cladonema pacificum]